MSKTKLEMYIGLCVYVGAVTVRSCDWRETRRAPSWPGRRYTDTR